MRDGSCQGTVLPPSYSAVWESEREVLGSIWLVTMFSFKVSPLSIPHCSPEYQRCLCGIVRLCTPHPSLPSSSVFPSSAHPLKDLVCAPRKHSRRNKIMLLRRKGGIMDIRWTQIFSLTL